MRSFLGQANPDVREAYLGKMPHHFDLEAPGQLRFPRRLTDADRSRCLPRHAGGQSIAHALEVRRGFLAPASVPHRPGGARPNRATEKPPPPPSLLQFGYVRLRRDSTPDL